MTAAAGPAAISGAAAPPAVAVSPRLERYLRRTRAATPPAPGEACELCAAPIAVDHRHLLEIESRLLRCVCSPCAILFDRRAAGAGRLRLVPDRVLRIEGLRLDEERWQTLAIPVGLAYFVRSSSEGRVQAFYPAPMGAVESRLGLEAWLDLERENPVLASVAPDVEALLVRRLPGGEDSWVVPIEACFELVAILRTRWSGLTGGERVWSEIEGFFAALAERARRVDREGRRGEAAPGRTWIEAPPSEAAD